MRRHNQVLMGWPALALMLGAGGLACSSGNPGQPAGTASGGSGSGGAVTPTSGHGGAGMGGSNGTGGDLIGSGGNAVSGSGGNVRPAGNGGVGAGGVGGLGGKPGTGGAGGSSDAGPATRDAASLPEAGKEVSGAGGANRDLGGEASGGTSGSRDGGTPGNITVWLAGDSTMANGSTPCPVGWGKEFQSFFGSNVKVTNSAQGGRSIQTWLYDVSTTMGSDGECVLNSTDYLSAWTTMLEGMKAGDYLFIQFGINDTDSSCNRHVGTALFQRYLGVMAQAAKQRGTTPILVTPVSSISCSGAKAQGTRGTYATATKQAATSNDAALIDLEQLSVALYTSLGFCPLSGADTAATFEAATPVGDFFCEDHTHFEDAGAKQIAGLMAQALRDQKIGLADYLK